MKLVVTDDAKEDIERISDHISTDNPRAAARLVKEFLRSFREIRQRPRAYPFVVGYER
jgi:plasmid stabilization system protein ParE